jgi:hypothetical protein
VRWLGGFLLIGCLVLWLFIQSLWVPAEAGIK